MNYSSLNADLETLERAIENNPDAQNNIYTALGGFIVVILIIGIIFCTLLIIALWKMFKKAGEKGWKSIIPIYNLVIAFRISGTSPWLILLYLLAGIPIIGWIISVAILIYYSNNLAKSFGKDVGYTVGLVIPATSWIFLLILGFGKAEYVGPAGKKEQAE